MSQPIPGLPPGQPREALLRAFRARLRSQEVDEPCNCPGCKARSEWKAEEPLPLQRSDIFREILEVTDPASGRTFRVEVIQATVRRLDQIRTKHPGRYEVATWTEGQSRLVAVRILD